MAGQTAADLGVRTGGQGRPGYSLATRGPRGDETRYLLAIEYSCPTGTSTEMPTFRITTAAAAPAWGRHRAHECRPIRTATGLLPQ